MAGRWGWKTGYGFPDGDQYKRQHVQIHKPLRPLKLVAPLRRWDGYGFPDGKSRIAPLVTGGKPRLKLQKMVEQQDHICPLCSKHLLLEEANIDHKVPKSKGGSNDQSNLQATHIICNSLKGDRLD